MTALVRVPLRGRNCILSECARCGRTRPIWARGLCNPCLLVSHRDGTYAGYERAREGRLASYAECRTSGDSVAVAASRVGVSKRTGERYEAQLAAWRRSPPAVGNPGDKPLRCA